MKVLVSKILPQKGAHVFSAHPDESIMATVHKLKDQEIGTLLVIDRDDIAGIISERDIVRGIAAHGIGALDKQVRDLMVKNVITCKPSDSLSKVMEIMTDHGFRHLPVVEDGKLKGLISIKDAVKFYIEDLQNMIALFEAQI